MKQMGRWICYNADMPLCEGDVVMIRNEDKSICTAKVVCDGNPNVILDFDIGDVFWNKRDVLMVLKLA